MLINPLAADIAGLPSGLVLTSIFVLGFIAAVTLGSIAWYNSNRPPRLGK